MALGFQIVATMFQITLTLSLILEEITVKEASKRRFYFYFFLAICMFLQIFSLVLIFSLNEDARKRRYKLEVAAYSLLTIIYFFVFILLNQKMSKLDIGTIHADKISIKC